MLESLGQRTREKIWRQRSGQSTTIHLQRNCVLQPKVVRSAYLGWMPGNENNLNEAVTIVVMREQFLNQRSDD